MLISFQSGYSKVNIGSKENHLCVQQSILKNHVKKKENVDHKIYKTERRFKK